MAEDKEKRILFLKFAGIDFWSRAYFKALGTRNYYGSCEKLFDEGDPARYVIRKLTLEDFCYMGNSFGCEPMGTPMEADEVHFVDLFIPLKSVGTFYDPSTGMCYPMKIDETPDLACSVHIQDCENDEWYDDLANVDIKAIINSIVYRGV